MRQCFLIDDDEDDQELFAMALKSVDNHIQLITASNGAEAISLLNSNTDLKPDFIFIDVNMPKMNGVECLKGIMTIDRLKTSTKFMFSTSAGPSVVNECKLIGADDFIVKPGSLSQLKQTLEKAIK
ncbi:MAG: response regulator [Cyclobacteriaceae bacterium]|nr:response regulator [Cyclobacteriaceae bacterium]